MTTDNENARRLRNAVEPTILEAQEGRATAMLRRVLGEQPEGLAGHRPAAPRRGRSALVRPHDLCRLLDHFDPWAEAIIDAGSYPQRLAGVYNVGGGPHFGFGLTIDTAAELHGAKG